MRVRSLLLSVAVAVAIVSAAPCVHAARYAAIVKDGRAFAPLRVTFQWLGADVSFNDGIITATCGSKQVTLEVGSRTASVNGQRVTLDAAPFVTGGRSFVPLRFVAEAFGAEVEYDASASRISVRSTGRVLVLDSQTPLEYSIAHQTTCAGLVTEIEKASVRGNIDACFAAIADPLKTYDGTLTGAQLRSEVSDILSICNGVGWFPELTHVTQHEVDYALEATRGKPVAFRVGDYYSGNPYIGLWVFREINGYWKVVAITSS